MKLKRTASTLILLAAVGGSIVAPKSLASEIREIQEEVYQRSSEDLDSVTQNVNGLFKDGNHREIISTSCNFQSRIDFVCEQVKQLPDSQKKLELSDLVYLANNLYFESRGALSLRQRAENLNGKIENYFTDRDQTCLTSNFEDILHYSSGNYGGVEDVVLRYMRLGLPENTPSIKEDCGTLMKAYKLYTEGKIVVNIPDEKFRIAINNNLGLKKNNTLFEKQQLMTIKELDLLDYDINDLTGINDMQNLLTLKLTDHPGLNFSLISYSRDNMLKSLKKIIVNNMQDEHTSCISSLSNLDVFEANGGNVSDASPIIDHIQNVKIKNQKIIGGTKQATNSGLTLPLYSLLITNYGEGPRLCSQLDNFKASNNGKVSGGMVSWSKSDLENVKQLTCFWDSEQFSGEYIVYLQ